MKVWNFFLVRKINYIIFSPCFGYFKNTIFYYRFPPLLSLKKSLRILELSTEFVALKFRAGSSRLHCPSAPTCLLVRPRNPPHLAGSREPPGGGQRSLAWESRLGFLLCEIRGRMRWPLGCFGLVWFGVLTTYKIFCLPWLYTAFKHTLMQRQTPQPRTTPMPCLKPGTDHSSL